MESIWYTKEELNDKANTDAIMDMCYMMWGNAHLEQIPEYFGEWMVLAGEKLGYVPTIENLDKHYDYSANDR
jgi:hypothetical protein